MATYYRSDNEKDSFAQPSYVIFNHSFKGPRDSYKINSDISAFRFDIYKLYETLDRIDFNIQDQQSNLLSGHTEQSNQETHVGTDELLGRINSLKSRISSLERGL